MHPMLDERLGYYGYDVYLRQQLPDAPFPCRWSSWLAIYKTNAIAATRFVQHMSWQVWNQIIMHPTFALVFVYTSCLKFRIGQLEGVITLHTHHSYSIFFLLVTLTLPTSALQCIILWMSWVSAYISRNLCIKYYLLVLQATYKFL